MREAKVTRGPVGGLTRCVGGRVCDQSTRATTVRSWLVSLGMEDAWRVISVISETASAAAGAGVIEKGTRDGEDGADGVVVGSASAAVWKLAVDSSSESESERA